MRFSASTNQSSRADGLSSTPCGVGSDNARPGAHCAFRLITVFGTGDPKRLSSGISEALVTTEYGLIIAVPCLLMFAFLSRKAKGILSSMEQTAVGFVNGLTPRN